MPAAATRPPTITLVGGGGTGATATAVVNGAGMIVAITLTNDGSGYTSPPAVVISGGGGTGAAAIATLTPSAATGVMAGSVITYQVTLVMPAGDSSTNVLTDTPPPGLVNVSSAVVSIGKNITGGTGVVGVLNGTTLTFTFGNLMVAAGGNLPTDDTITITITGTVPAGDASGTVLINTATLGFLYGAVAARRRRVVVTGLPTGTVGTAYSDTLTASGGTAPYTFAETAAPCRRA